MMKQVDELQDDRTLACRIWQTAAHELKIEYAVADAQGKIVTHSASLANLLAAPLDDLRQTSLLDLCPALYGNEDMLDLVVHRRVPRWEVPKVQVAGTERSCVYVTLVVVPFTYRDAPSLLLFAIDVSEQGVLEQKLTQQRNEITLIQQRLAETNRRLDYVIKNYVPPAIAEQLLRNDA